jgi:hypothetical protein
VNRPSSAAVRPVGVFNMSVTQALGEATRFRGVDDEELVEGDPLTQLLEERLDFR